MTTFQEQRANPGWAVVVGLRLSGFQLPLRSGIISTAPPHRCHHHVHRFYLCIYLCFYLCIAMCLLRTKFRSESSTTITMCIIKGCTA